MSDVKTWYLSKTVWGGLVAILASAAQLAGLEIGVDDQGGLVDGFSALAAAIGGILAIYGRISATKRLR